MCPVATLSACQHANCKSNPIVGVVDTTAGAREPPALHTQCLSGLEEWRTRECVNSHVQVQSSSRLSSPCLPLSLSSSQPRHLRPSSPMLCLSPSTHSLAFPLPWFWLSPSIVPATPLAKPPIVFMRCKMTNKVHQNFPIRRIVLDQHTIVRRVSAIAPLPSFASNNGEAARVFACNCWCVVVLCWALNCIHLHHIV